MSDVTASCDGQYPDSALSLLVERNTAESFTAEAVVPGVEVYADRDVTWVVHSSHVWRNAGVMVRFSDASAPGRLDTMVDRYRRHRRGMGLWISPAARPVGLATLLQSRKMRCRKHFPAMVRSLADPVNALRMPTGLTIRPVCDVDEFETTAHPAIGLPTTTLRKSALLRLRALVAASPQQIMPFVAYLRGEPVGASELFLGSGRVAGLIGMSVLEAHRGRGIGAALLEHTCQEAAMRGATSMALIATSDGERLYTRRGFVEVARFGYWYRSFQRGGESSLQTRATRPIRSRRSDTSRFRRVTG
jgi:ribosomal protein S18 acetylase RimI-like enzyme